MVSLAIVGILGTFTCIQIAAILILCCLHFPVLDQLERLFKDFYLIQQILEVGRSDFSHTMQCLHRSRFVCSMRSHLGEFSLLLSV